MTININNNFKSLNKKPTWLNINSPQIRDFDLIIGWDSEYWNDTDKIKLDKYLDEIRLEKDLNKRKKLKLKALKIINFENNLLSYQFIAYYPKKDKYLEKVIYQTKKKSSLQDLLKEVFLDLDISHYEISKKKINSKSKKIRYKYFQILLVAHYSLAEWSMLRKRHLINKKLINIQELFLNEYNKTEMKEVYGTLTSFIPFDINIPEYKGRNESIKLFWQDTYLYTSSKNRSLESISKSKSIFNKKLEIPLPYKKDRMDILLKENKELFQEYALQDARIALEFYCSYMYSYYTASKVDELPITIGDGSVKWYLKHLENKSIKENKFDDKGELDKKWYEKETLGIEWTRGRKRQKTRNRWMDEWFANNTFYGAINTTYYLGKFQKDTHWIIDIDISNCYPISLSVQPIIDWKKHSKKYVTYDILKEKTFSQEKFIDIGIFLIDNFEFSKDTYQTSFPEATEGGLIYLRKGRNININFPELITAIKQNVKIDKDFKELRIFNELKDDNNEPILAFADFLEFLIKERKKCIKEEKYFEADIYKQSYLSFYGKTGQGVKTRFGYNLLGEKIQIPESKITCPHYASMCTSLVRCAIIDMINYFQSLEGIQVLNATTDGMMIAVPKSYFPKDFKIEIDDKGIVDCSKMNFQEIFPKFFQDLNTHYSIRYLLQGRKNLKLDNNFLEIKHFGDLAHSWKTRVNCIVYKGITQHIARVSMDRNIKTYEDLLKYDTNEIETMINTSLVSIKDMLKYKCDLIPKYYLINHYDREKKVNLDSDYKRFINSNQQSTRTFEDIDEWIKHRELSRQIRKSNKRASYDLVELSKKNKEGNRVRIQGSLNQTVARIFLGGLLRYNWLSKKMIYREIVEILEKWRLNNYSNSKWFFDERLLWDVKRRKFFQKSLPNTPKIKEQIISMSKALNTEDKIDEIFDILLRS